jgi:hypothetical protein
MENKTYTELQKCCDELEKMHKILKPSTKTSEYYRGMNDERGFVITTLKRILEET